MALLFRLSRLAPSTQVLLRSPSRHVSLGQLKGYDEREHVEENLFAKKEDEKALRRLLAKMTKQVEAMEPAAAAESKQEAIAALRPIIDKYKMSAHDVETLLEWKNTPDFDLGPTI